MGPRRVSNQGAVTFATLPTTPLSATTGSSGPEEEQFADVRHVKFFLDNRLPSLYFKQDILRLIHSLKIARWKRVDMAMAADLQIKRMSGALTNAIYSVEPPSYLKEMVKAAFANDPKLSGKTYHHWMPSKVLLRVYGSQVDHLIDRDVELAVLQRLARKEIGPKLLGTFTNGRFEQFFHAIALTKHDLRKPDVSVQIAKRMRELHENIELLESELSDGPTVWKNLEKWFDRAEVVLAQLEERDPGSTVRILQSDVGGFKAMLAKYRQWVTVQYGGEEGVRKELVFCHNDTQYGNILRFVPPPGSPLLTPRHEHRQLVVIDFEYSAANVRGFDIANHFCEWMNDYHDEERPHHIWDELYPNPECQENFIQSYVEHGMDTFDDEAITQQTEYLLKQTLHWRAAVSAYWCIWGIVQAVVDVKEEMKEREEKDEEQGYRFIEGGDKSPTLEETEVVDEGDEFDYISYATEKAQLFWSDMIKLGLLNEADYHGTLKPIAH